MNGIAAFSPSLAKAAFDFEVKLPHGSLRQSRVMDSIFKSMPVSISVTPSASYIQVAFVQNRYIEAKKSL